MPGHIGLLKECKYGGVIREFRHQPPPTAMPYSTSTRATTSSRSRAASSAPTPTQPQMVRKNNTISSIYSNISNTLFQSPPRAPWVQYDLLCLVGEFSFIRDEFKLGLVPLRCLGVESEPLVVGEQVVFHVVETGVMTLNGVVLLCPCMNIRDNRFFNTPDTYRLT